MVCGGNLCVVAPELYDFPTVTSDCRPWPAGRAVATCQACGIMQRSLLPDAASRIRQVYTGYEMFKHSNIGSDQLNFSPQGIPQARTEKILQFIEGKLHHKPASVLDIGSGSGAGLIALANQFPSAKIYGFEPNDKPAERQAAMPDNVVSIVSELPAATEKYDLVTLFHVLEHVEEVFDLLRFIGSVLSSHGNLLIQVPYATMGPFDYVISDHVWHFTQQSMVAILHKANFHVIYIGHELIEKELTVVASYGAEAPQFKGFDESKQTVDSITWLLDYKQFLDAVKRDACPCAVYGTGPSGAWAGQVLGDCVTAYIDDDPARVNATFNGKPVLPPHAIAAGMPVIAPFPDQQFRWIAEKNKALNILQPFAKAA